MKRIIFLLALVMGLTSVNAQTWQKVAGNWEYKYLRIDSSQGTFRPPMDTLAGASVGSIAIKNDTLYRKRPNGVWAAVGAASGTGISSIGAIGSAPNGSGASISGSVLTLQPASGSFGGVVTTLAQIISGNKTFTGPKTNFLGHSPILNAQYSPTQIVSDSIYNNRYIGFGGIDVFPDGTFVMVFTDSYNHIGDSAFLRIAKSTNQGKTWAIDTLLRISGDTSLSMGGMGVSESGRLIVFYYKFNTTTTFNQYIIYSDDKGATWSTPYLIPHLTEPIYNPYGGLCKAANGRLLLSWYGYTVGGVFNVYAIRSDDDGATWSSSTKLLGSNVVRPTETMFTHLGGGYILGLTRSDSTFKYTQTLSRDNGVTWDSIGRVSFGFQATPAWVKTYIDGNGKRVVVAYYRYSPTADVKEIHAIYGMADSLLINGANGWDLTTEKTIATSVDGSGYISIVHPNDGPAGYGYHYDENSPQFRTALKFVRVPFNDQSPIGPGGIYGLTAGRIPVVNSNRSVVDYNTLKYNPTDTAIVLGGIAGRNWSSVGGVVEGGNSAVMFNSGNLGLMNNLYLGTVGGVEDYRYSTTGIGSTIFLNSGSFYFYNAPTGTINNAATLTERIRMSSSGVLRINNSGGTPNYSLVSQGESSQTIWASRYFTLRDFNADANNSGTSETDLYAQSIDADVLHANLQKLAFDVSGTFNDATATPRVRLYFAGTLIYDSGVLTISGTGSWNATVLVMRINSTFARARVVFSADNTTLSAPVSVTQISGMDYTAANIIKVTGEASGAGGGSSDITASIGTIAFVP